MIRTIHLIILVVLSCTVLSGCRTIVKEVKQATPVNTVDADAEDTWRRRDVEIISITKLFKDYCRYKR